MIQVRSIKKEQVADVWFAFIPLLKAAWEEDLEEIEKQALAGHYQLWTVFEKHKNFGCFVTAVDEHEGQKALQVLYVTGRFTKAGVWAIKDAALAMMKHVGAERIEGTTSHNVKRLLHNLGFQEQQNYWWRN